MIRRIRKVQPMPDFMLDVLFDDGKHILYDVKEDMRDIPNYRLLREVCGLFQQVQLDESRTCIYWNEEIDLPSDSIYEYGRPI